MSNNQDEIDLDTDDEGQRLQSRKNTAKESQETASGSAMPPEQSPNSDLSLLTSAIYKLTEHLMGQENTEKASTSKGKGKGPAKRHLSQLTSSNDESPAKKRRHADEDDRDPEEIMNELIGSDDPILSDRESDSDNDVDEFLVELQKEYESEDKQGAKLQSKQLAKLADKMLRHRMSDKALKEKLERQERPENCNNVKPTRVNPGIWRKLRDHTKRSDGQMYKIQQALIKGIIPVLRMTDLSMTGSLSNKQIQDMKKMGLEALSLLAHSNYEINVQRKQLMKSDIGRDYAYLCSSQMPFSDMLFGDDLQKQLKDIGDQNKIGAKIQHKDYRSHSYTNGSKYTYRNSKNLKGQGYKHWKAKEGQKQNPKHRQESK